MKKLLFILIVILFSCEKKESICWECVIHQTKDTDVIQIYCDKSEEEIRHIEKINTFYHNLHGNWWNQTCECEIKK